MRTGSGQAAQQTKDVASFTSIIQKFLLAFGGIALFVGIFVIANTLSITIAQRAREFGTLRTIGATRRQILGSVIIEGVLVGFIASVIGLFLGLLLAKGLDALFKVFGADLPEDRHRVRDADGDRLAGCRHGRNVACEPVPGLPGDARRADRRCARGSFCLRRGSRASESPWRS